MTTANVQPWEAEFDAAMAAPAKKIKYPQFILAMESLFFDHDAFLKTESKHAARVFKFPYGAFVAGAHDKLVIRQRERLEKEAEFRQLLPYIIITQVGKDGVRRYLPYRRIGKSGEVRLSGNVSVGYGGHIDMADVIHHDSIIDLNQTIHDCLKRETNEEIHITERAEGLGAYGYRFADLFLVDDSDDDNGVHKMHVGIIVLCEIDPDVVAHTKEDDLEAMPQMTGEELLSSGLPMEKWTRMFLEYTHQEPSATE